MFPPTLSHTTLCVKATSQDISYLSCLTSFSLPTNYILTLFLFLLSPWHGSKQAESHLYAPFLITELQYRRDTGPGTKLRTEEKLTAASREKKSIILSLLTSFCSLREGRLIASAAYRWFCSSLGFLSTIYFLCNNIKTDKSYLLLSQGKGGFPGW